MRSAWARSIRSARGGAVCLDGGMSASPSPTLRGMWLVSLGLLLLVFGAVTARWIGAEVPTPPSGWLPLLTGLVALPCGLRWPRLRLPAWTIGWAGLLWVAADLVRIQRSLDRPLPALYLALFLGMALLVPTCVWEVRLSTKRQSPPTGLV